MTADGGLLASPPQNAPAKAPPSMRMFCPVMKPAWALARKAQSAPNSAGSPNCPTGICAFELARATSTLTPRCAAVSREAGFLPVGFKRSGLDRVDRDVVAREQPRRGSEKRG